MQQLSWEHVMTKGFHTHLKYGCLLGMSLGALARSWPRLIVFSLLLLLILRHNKNTDTTNTVIIVAHFIFYLLYYKVINIIYYLFIILSYLYC